VLVGFVSSLFKSKRIIKAFDFESMSGNTSIFSILFLMTLTVTLFYFKTYILLTSSLEITLVFFYIFLYYKYLKVNQSKIYQKIVKTVL
jgi:hypothetical protein